MQQSSLVAEFLDTLSYELGFDRRLAGRVRREVEDHLWESASGEPDGASIEAQRRAIANFGDAHEIARHYAATSLFKQTKRIGTILILVIAGVFLLMRARIAWFGPMQFGADDNLRQVSTFILSIVRYAFMLTLGIGVISMAYVGSRRTPVAYETRCRGDLQWCYYLCGLAAASLFVSVSAEALLMLIRLWGTALSLSGLIRVLGVAAEAAFVGVLIATIRMAMRRSAVVASQFGN